MHDLKINTPGIQAALAVALTLGVTAAFWWSRPKPEAIRTAPTLQVAAPLPVDDEETAPPETVRRRFPAREKVVASRPGAEGSGNWWVGTMGVALALAFVGWGSVAARRYLPQGANAPLAAVRVVGRTSLSPRHSVYLLDVGGRVLIVGTGPQGAPSLLGELGEPPASSRHFDHRLGDDT